MMSADFSDEMSNAREAAARSLSKCLESISFPGAFAAVPPKNEEERLAMLHSLNILDTAPEGMFS